MGKVVKAVVGIVVTVAGVVTGNPYLVAQGLTMTVASLKGGTKQSLNASGLTSRVNIDTNVRDWIVVGETATPAQLIYFGTSGSNNEFLSMIFVHACHRIAGFTALNLNNIATSFPTPSGPYAGVLSIQSADGTQTANPFTSVNGGQWGAAHIGRERAMSHFRWTYDKDKLASGLPQNLQFVIKGIAVYDPRRDSTRGGSGSHRADNEATWQYEVSGVPIGRNPALVDLSYRLGWRKNGRLWAGMGEDPGNLDYAAYIASANICDEVVGGKPRYRIDGLLSLGDIHNVNLGKIHATCGGKPLETGGLIGLWVAHDDTATALMTLTDSDWVGDVAWQPLPEGQIRNTARGSFVDPASGYQAQPYREVAPSDLLALDNGEEIADQLDFAMIQDADQARRLASIRLRESRQGRFAAPTALKALGLRPADVAALVRPRVGWTSRRFRVETMALAIDQVLLGMRAVQASDYADVANVTSATPGSLPTTGFIPVLGVLAFRDFVDFATEVTGNEKPDNGATAGENLIQNSALVGGVAPWGLDPAVTRIGGSGATDTGYLRFAATGSTIGAFANANDARPLAGAGKLFVSCLSNRVATAGAAEVWIDWFTGSGAAASIPRTVTSVWPPTAGVAVMNDFIVTAPADATQWKAIWVATGTNGTVDIDKPRVSASELAADVTSGAQVVVITDGLQAYDASYTGVIVGTLEPTQVRVSRGGVSIKGLDGVAYSITNSSGLTATIDNTNGSATKGLITPTAFAGNYATCIVTVTVDGVVQPAQTIVFQKTLALPPALGGSTAKTATDTSLTAISSTSFVAISDVMTVALASGETLYGTAVLDYSVSGSSAATRTVDAKWQRSPTSAGTWTDFTGSAETGSVANSGGYNVFDEYVDASLGAIDASQASAPAAGTYDVRLVAAVSASGRTISFYGSAIIEAKV